MWHRWLVDTGQRGHRRGLLKSPTILPAPVFTCSFNSILKTDSKTKIIAQQACWDLLSISHLAITLLLSLLFSTSLDAVVSPYSPPLQRPCTACLPLPPVYLHGKPQTCKNPTIHLLWVWRRKTTCHADRVITPSPKRTLLRPTYPPGCFLVSWPWYLPRWPVHTFSSLPQLPTSSLPSWLTFQIFSSFEDFTPSITPSPAPSSVCLHKIILPAYKQFLEFFS